MMYVRILRVHRLKTWKEQAETMTGRAAADTLLPPLLLPFLLLLLLLLHIPALA